MYFIGQLGNTSIAGGSVSMSVIMVLMTVFIGLMTATAAFISRAYGSNNHDRIPVILAHSLIMAAIVSVIIALIGIFWSEDILLILSQDAEVAAERRPIPRATSHGYIYDSRTDDYRDRISGKRRFKDSDVCDDSHQHRQHHPESDPD
jgi:Na+-driven multidrug efflux pump